MTARVVVLAGPSGSGKTVLGRALAARLAVPFLDADDLHPPENRAAMAAGTPLTDADRAPWLDLVAEAMRERAPLVLACSALGRRHRERLLASGAQVLFVQLRAPREALALRMRERSHDFMPASLLDSQLDALEPLHSDEPGIVFDAVGGVEADAGRLAAALGTEPE